MEGTIYSARRRARIDYAATRLMRIHHLDCCSMCPFPERLVNGRGSMFRRGRMVAHCLLIETAGSGLVLVDTGIGLADIAAPSARLGKPFVAATGLSHPSPKMSAFEQVKALGHDPRDVRHILPTHLDLDHAGGLPDFPWATVHLHTAEHAAALHPTTMMERNRYRSVHFAHDPKWATYDATGEPWKGFPAVRALPGLPVEILAIPLPGHTRGHACIAVDSGKRWLLHAGDAYFGRGAIDGAGAPFGLALFEKLAAIDGPKVQENHQRLGELARAHSEDLTVFSAHDADEFDALRNASEA